MGVEVQYFEQLKYQQVNKITSVSGEIHTTYYNKENQAIVLFMECLIN